MAKVVTCVRLCGFIENLTRGQQYEVVEEDRERQQVRVRNDKGRLRWFPQLYFDLIPALVSWQFSAAIEDEIEQPWCPDVSFTLSDGTRRGCTVATPQFLTLVLEPPMPQPAFWASELIIVRSYATEAVDQALRHLDEKGVLIQASTLIEPVEEDED